MRPQLWAWSSGVRSKDRDGRIRGKSEQKRCANKDAHPNVFPRDDNTQILLIVILVDSPGRRQTCLVGKRSGIHKPSGDRND